MKRVKMMLLSLALFAVVGGALAFKAKFDQSFCKTNAIEINGVLTCRDANNVLLTCPDKIVNSTIDPTVGATPAFCTTTLNLQGQCPGAACGATPTSIVNDGQ